MLWHGLDISVWDGDIDLSQWKAKRGLSFVIIKAGGNEKGLGRYKDSKFETNYKKAVDAGLHVGAYYYTVTTDIVNARADADHFAQLLYGKTFDMPVYIDVEDPGQFKLSKRALTDVVKAFCDRMNVIGYYAGLYTGGYAYQANMYGPDELSNYADWIAWWREAWPTECGDVGMHQVGGIRLSDGDIVYDDVEGHHDYDRCIIDYPSRISGNASDAETPTPSPEKQEPVTEESSKSDNATVEHLMEVAYGELGYYAPSDPERGSKYGRWAAELTGEDWLAGPSTSIWWCCMYASWVLYHAGVSCPGFPTQNTDVALANGAKTRAVNKNDIHRGDIIIFDWNWDGATDHIGFATSSLVNGKFTTIEGNVTNAVKELTRDLSNVAYVIRPLYQNEGTSSSTPSESTTPSVNVNKAKNNRDGGKLDVDGIAGYNTILDLQHILGTTEDGYISGQPDLFQPVRWAVYSIQSGNGGSQMVEALQNFLRERGYTGSTTPGIWDQALSAMLQSFLVDKGYSCGSCGVDGYFGKDSVRALQECINDGKFN